MTSFDGMTPDETQEESVKNMFSYTPHDLVSALEASRKKKKKSRPGRSKSKSNVSDNNSPTLEEVEEATQPLSKDVFQDEVVEKEDPVAFATRDALLPSDEPPVQSSTYTTDETPEEEEKADLLSTEKKPKDSLRSDCYAPPGKLGVAIDSGVDGKPIVHRIKPGSPLEGFLVPMDRIVAIDDVDTTCMSAADVTHLMVKKMNQRRKISFVRTAESILDKDIC